MGLEQLALLLEKFEPLFQFLPDLLDGAGDSFLGQHEMFRRIDEHFLRPVERFAAGGIDD